MVQKIIIQDGIVTKIKTDKFDINFNKEYNTGFYINSEKVQCVAEKEGLYGIKNDIEFRLKFEEKENEIIIHSYIKNITKNDIHVKNLGLLTGIDCYMEGYPEWNEKFFPTMLRCEKTHLWGYFESPQNNILAIAVTEPVASYHFEYNKIPGDDFGHRIYTASIDFFKDGKLPERHPQQRNKLSANTEYEFNLHLIPAESAADIPGIIYRVCGLPMISAEKYTLESGEMPRVNILAGENYTVLQKTPQGEVFNEIKSVKEYGKYILEVTDKKGKTAQAVFFCREDWGEYLKKARTEMLRKPQKASTHCESLYGFFSGFLAAKHYPEAAEDAAVLASFEEIFPLVWDKDKKLPKTAPFRIQNTAALISVLVDKYQLKHNIKDLIYASEMGDFLMSAQTEDGAYRNKGIHYTCVIYIAKSMLELSEAEQKSDDPFLRKKGEEHYQSVKKAVDELVLNLECIGTEGEHTLEDGMISCSALQIAAFALTLAPEDREKYINAAEHMIKVHSCLEQNLIPDSRMNGASLRFWEAQYDVMIRANFMNSPHGWSAWTAYAKYYLYLLTGKDAYLKELLNLMGACAQLMDLSGKLRWAFAVDPYICAESLVPNILEPVEDGYKNVTVDNPAYRGKYIEKVFGEEYIDMISGWYRTGSRLVTGGYEHCPLIDENDNCIEVDNQGGACDNDVHEIFKCMEETVLKKAFIHECKDRHYTFSSCHMDGEICIINDEVEQLCFCTESPISIMIKKQMHKLESTDGKVVILNL